MDSPKLEVIQLLGTMGELADPNNLSKSLWVCLHSLDLGIGRGEQLLKNQWPKESFISNPFLMLDATDTVNKILQKALGKKVRRDEFLTKDKTPFTVRHNVVNEERCLRLVKAIVGNGNERNLHLNITEAELKGIIGRSAVDKILELGRSRLSPVGILYTKPYFVVSSRIAAFSYVIPFHYDANTVVVNVTLNEDLIGGDTFFVNGANVHYPSGSSSIGTATVHTCRVVHGTSQLELGVQYNLQAVFNVEIGPSGIPIRPS